MQKQRMGPPIEIRADKCVGCLSCELSCSLRLVKAFSPVAADIRVTRLAAGAGDFHVEFTESCDRCGVCVAHCKYGALIQLKRAT